jgi:protein-disulfide isomerase
MRATLIAATLALAVVGARAVSRRLDAHERRLDAHERHANQLERKVDAAAASVGTACPVVGHGGHGLRPGPDNVFAVSVDGDPVAGPADALVTLVVGYEYACPYCDKARTVLRELRGRYPDDLRIAWKAYVVHPHVARVPALAACAAAYQGKFFAMDDLLWSEAFAQRTFEADHIRGLASEAGLDLLVYDADVHGRCRDEIDADQAELQGFGFVATPTFYINGRPISGVQPMDELVEIIDAELSLAHERIVASGTAPRDYYQEWVIGHGRRKWRWR